MERTERAIQIGKRLRDVRGIRPKTKVALAAGVSYSELCKIESGLRIPKTETMRKLANYYGVSLDYLFLSD